MSIVLLCAYADKDDQTGTVTPCQNEATVFIRDSNGTSYPCCEAHVPPQPTSALVT